MDSPLNDVRVIDFSSEIAGPYATKLFTDGGADVIKVESTSGDPFRRRAVHGEDLGGGDAALFRFLHAGQRSIVGHHGDPDVLALVAGADLVVESGELGIDVDGWRERFPHLVILSLSPYGRTGPFVGRPATPFTVEAESGCLAVRGLPDGEPFQVGARLLEWSQGTFAAVGALAAVWRARATGVGEQVDSTLLLAAYFASTGAQQGTGYVLDGEPPRTGPVRVVEVPSVEPTKDGWVGVNINTYQQFADFVVMIGQPQLLDDGRPWSKHRFRFDHMEEWNEMVRSWTRAHTTAEILAIATDLRIPVAPISNGGDVIDFEQFKARGIYDISPDGDFVQPQPPSMIDGVRPSVRTRAPLLGEHTGTIELRPWPGSAPPAVEGPRTSQALPFEGLRVLDATTYWAGPTAGHIFACLGADVIHLESIRHPDQYRFVVSATQQQRPQWWERGAALTANTNKRDVTLPLDQEEGRRLFERLLSHCDVLVEDYSPRVFDNFGLTPQHIHALNPRIVFLRMPAFGLDGPWRNNVAFAQTMEQASGLAWLTGHRDDQPRVPRGPCDPMAGYHGAFAVMAALHHRSTTGIGAFVESAFVESTLNCAAEAVTTFTGYGVLLERQGNRSAEAAPQGVYRTAGWECWLALSVATDEQWGALRRLLGHPGWAAKPELNTLSGRRAAHDLIDGELQKWAADKDLRSVIEQLIEVGIPAGSVEDPRTCRHHPQFEALNYFEVVEHPVVGSYVASGPPFRLGSVDRWLRSPAPTLGQHNHEVLSELLGLTDDDVRRLEAQEVIGTRPAGL